MEMTINFNGNKKVNAELVARLQTNKEGFFKVELPPGKYSVFVLDVFYFSCWICNFWISAKKSYLISNFIIFLRI